jgi:hypothetical protein
LISHDDFCNLGAPRNELHQREALDLLVEMAKDCESKVPGGADLFVSEVFAHIWAGAENWLDLDAVMKATLKDDGKKKVASIRRNLRRDSAYFWNATGWAVEALRPWTDGQTGRTCIQFAERVFGMYLGGQMAMRDSIPLTRAATLGSDARQKDNRANRDHVFAWADKHADNYPSLNKAALAIYESHQVSAELKTIRNWLTQWKRERKFNKSPTS